IKAAGRSIPRPPGLWFFAFDSSMTRYALRFRNGTVVVRRVADDQEVARFHAGGDRGIPVFRFSPDGRYLATTHDPAFALSVWDVDRQSRVVHDPGPVYSCAARFSPDGSRIAVVHNNAKVLVYDMATGQSVRHWPLPAPGDLAFRSDGIQVAVVPAVQ